MKLKRHFLGKLNSNLFMLLILWVIAHLAGWYSNGFVGLFSLHLILTTIGVTLLLSLLLSSSGNSKNDLQFGLPFINSYLEAEHVLKISSGGLNFFMRVFYFILSLILIGVSLSYDAVNNLSLVEAFLGLIFLFGILFYTLRVIRNFNDFLSINAFSISWYDNSKNGKIELQFKDILSFKVENEQYKSVEHPKSIILNTLDKNYTINLKEMSMLQFSSKIIQHLENIIELNKKD
jgi:hypothetical protein